MNHHTLLGAAQDVRVTSVQDDHGGAAEQLTASGTELNLLRLKQNTLAITYGTLQSHDPRLLRRVQPQRPPHGLAARPGRAIGAGD